MINFMSPHRLAGLDQSEPILLALSGGADSSALLSLLAKYCERAGCKLYAAHIDHQIRDDEHDRDREFCKRMAEKYGAEIFVLEADVPKIASESGESVELAARRVRYEFFSKIMKENGIRILATAHNADDNFETLLFNLARGTGLRGLCGIPKARALDGGIAVRPILGTKKNEILEYCRENGIEFVEDRTNADDSYSRNRIRLRVIPELLKINPDAQGSASRLAEDCALDLDFIKKSARILIDADGSIDLEKLLAAHPALARHAIAIAFGEKCEKPLEHVHIEAVLHLCEGNKSFSSVSLPGKMMARIENGALRFLPEQKETDETENYEIRLQVGKNMIGRHILLYNTGENTKNIYKSETQITIPSDRIIGGLFARTRKAGDKILVGGMHKDVRKLISEKKIPPENRASLPLICDEEEILWIPGVAAADKIRNKRSKSEYIALELQI